MEPAAEQQNAMRRDPVMGKKFLIVFIDKIGFFVARDFSKFVNGVV